MSGGGSDLPIVGIGASAGGIDAFHGFFANMPPDSGLGFVAVLHLPTDRKTLLPAIISRWTNMPVSEATEGCEVRANHVYVPPSGVGVALRGGHLHLIAPGPDGARELSPITVFFDSLAAELGEEAIGVVLSGTGNDGALGLKAIKSCGGLTFAQASNADGPQHDGMPTSAVATGAVDVSAPVEDIPRHILTIRAARRAPARTGGEMTAADTDAARLAICSVLLRQIGHDFSGYKDKTFLRRVQRRMQVLGLGALPSYRERLEEDRNEVLTLFRDLLIGVTSFFRDPDTFEAINTQVIPGLFAGKDAQTTIRVWVAGCATGEEAYSLAILLCEHRDTLTGSIPRIQVFATDIDEAAIAAARSGRYPSTLVQGLSTERRSRFFVPGADGSFVVGKEVRELCTFSAHSLTRNPPFSRVDMVSCRNLLIYLDTDLQADVIPAFHYALVPDGILLLGSSETVSRSESLFAPVDKQHRIYRRRDTPTPPIRTVGRTGLATVAPGGQSKEVARLPPVRTELGRLGERAIARTLERFAPVFVVCDAVGEIVHFSAGTGRFLEPVAGLPSQNVLLMARPGLRLHLRGALRQVVETGRGTERTNVSVDIAGNGGGPITLAIEPLAGTRVHPLYLVAFVEPTQNGEADDRAPREHAERSGPDHALEAELRDTREQLQSVTEEHETALEELRSANEELHSVNEELQSANEELETSKEEIQSINEELQTVNGQLAGKVDELDRKNTDLTNLFESTQVATIFLDPYLIIRGFTPAVADIYNLIPSDQGRPLTDIVSRLRYSGLRDDVEQVLSTLMPLERRVARNDAAAHYLMRMLPYRTPDSRIDGAIVTFVNVTSIVQAEQRQSLLVDELNHRVKNMLTVVISLASQTLRRSGTLDDFAESYMGRVHALNAAYSLLSGKAWSNVLLDEVIAEEIKPFLAPDGSNVRVDGPMVLLEPRAALALGMAVHELTTNAVKYGALSVPEGNVAVTWRTEDRADARYLLLDWVESGGPPVSAPERPGFGMTLIERGLKHDMGAAVNVTFAVQGVRARLEAALTVPGPALST